MGIKPVKYSKKMRFNGIGDEKNTLYTWLAYFSVIKVSLLYTVAIVNVSVYSQFSVNFEIIYNKDVKIETSVNVELQLYCICQWRTYFWPGRWCQSRYGGGEG